MGRKKASASCRRAEPAVFRPAGTAQSGFTLLELLVVMAVLAGLAAIAVPQFAQLYDRVRASFERADVERQLLELPQLVRSRGRGGVLRDPAGPGAAASGAADGVPVGVGEAEKWDSLSIDLPPGWTMRVPKPVLYRFTGVCSGGEVDLSLPPTKLRYILHPPLCRPQIADGNAP